jgi:hypothetical protein
MARLQAKVFKMMGPVLVCDLKFAMEQVKLSLFMVCLFMVCLFLCSLSVHFAFALPSLCLCFAFALLLLPCVCVASALLSL